MKYEFDENANKTWNIYFNLHDIERYIFFCRRENPDAGIVIEDGIITAIEC